MPSFTIDLEKCDKDAICMRACPTNVIQLDTLKKHPVPTPDHESYCLNCGHCVAVCPTGAFQMERLGHGDWPSVKKDLVLTAEQAEHFIRSRRSIRNFKHQPVERHKLEKLIEMACYAPSAKNSQPWHWTIVEDPADVRRYAKMVIDWMRIVIEQFPEQAEIRGLTRVVNAWDDGQERICRGAPHIVVVHGDKTYGFGAEDSALALSYFELFAPTIGLGSCWGGYFYSAVNAHPPLFEALGLPAQHRAFGAVMVGYPQLSYQRLPLRNAPRVSWLSTSRS